MSKRRGRPPKLPGLQVRLRKRALVRNHFWGEFRQTTVSLNFWFVCTFLVLSLVLDMLNPVHPIHPLQLPLTSKKLDLSTLLKDVAEKSIVWEVPLIRRAFTYENPDTHLLTLKTDGINIQVKGLT
uniref:(California timema) hypothetical protein n=1 Tax=Timema californicum TaxID=61474 RepID=A0A7R9JKF8_TIMCA|nr:unnamed protein product [Timema californicum]